MGGLGGQLPPSSSGPPQPQHTSMDTLFNGGSSSGGGGASGGFGFSSPGPMTLVSNFFNENDDFKSFSQLLSGVMPPSPLVPDGGATAGYMDPSRPFPTSHQVK